MSVFLRMILIIGALLLMVFMLKKIRQSKLKIEYIIFWIVFSLLLVLMGIFPKLFYIIADLIGFQSPISMVYLLIFFVLIVKLFFMTIQISQLENKLDQLAQKIALDNKKEQDVRKCRESASEGEKK